MADSSQFVSHKTGGQETGNTKNSPSSFQHPPVDSYSTETRESPTMDSPASRMNEAARLSETQKTDVEARKADTQQGGAPMENPSGNGFRAGDEENQGQTGGDPTPNRATGCTSGYIPSPGPKEQPNTNMRDVAEVDHVEEAQRHEQTHFMAVPLDVLPPNADIPEYDLHLLNLARHADPFRMLGCHKVEGTDSGKRVVVVRAWLKNVSQVELRPRDGVSDWRLPPPLESVPLEKKGDLLFQKAGTKHQIAAYTHCPVTFACVAPVRSLSLDGSSVEG